LGQWSYGILEYWVKRIFLLHAHHSNTPLFQHSVRPGLWLAARCSIRKKLLDESWRKAVWKTAFGGVLEWSR
jgi:hypothetical protein